MQTILYTYTDEAPALATHSFLPILRELPRHLPVSTVELRDISLAGRILPRSPTDCRSRTAALPTRSQSSGASPDA
jgi:monomeric isocitrate dehydrogenase